MASYSATTYNPGSYNPTTSPVYYHNVKSIDPAYWWIVLTAGVMCFFVAFVVAANNMGDAWGTSVGARALTVRKAAILAVIFEISGVFALGRNSGEAIKWDIISPRLYCDDNYSLVTRMNGMVSVLFAVFIWLLGTTWFRIPVSCSQTVIAAVCAFGIVTRGWDQVAWWDPAWTVGGFKAGPMTMAKLFISWGTSPVLAAFFAFFVQLAVRKLLFQGKPGSVYKKNHLWLPVIGGVVLGLAVIYAIFIGGKSQKSIRDLDAWIFAVIWGSVTIFSVIVLVILCKWLRKKANVDLAAFEDVEPRLHNDVKDETTWDDSVDGSGYHATNGRTYPEWDSYAYPTAPNASPYTAPSYPAFAPMDAHHDDHDAHHDTHHDAHHEDAHHDTHHAPVPHAATFFDGRVMEGPRDIWEGVTEEEFASQQLWVPVCWVLAMVYAFAHGANDIGDSVAPFTDLLDMYATPARCPVGASVNEWWILGLAAGGMVCGLVILGHRVLRTIGVGIAVITPQKAAVAEFSAIFTILIAAVLTIPVTTTHCVISAIVGATLCDGGARKVNWTPVFKIFFALVMTVPAVALMSAGIFVFWEASVFGAAYPGPSAFNTTCNATWPGPW